MSALRVLGELLSHRNSAPRAGWQRLSRDEEQAAAELGTQLLAGKSLAEYIPNCLVPLDKRMAALAVGGAPAWSRRLRRIDALTDAALVELEAAWRQLARTRPQDPRAFATLWREQAARADFRRVNDLIRRHNQHLPAEANLAMDVRTGDFVGPGGGDYRRQPLDAEWVLSRFPPELSLALG
jgi:hypothetical protein